MKLQMKIIFKNGHEKEIPYEVAKMLRDNLLEGCADFQYFIDENDKVFLIVNLKEIVCVETK